MKGLDQQDLILHISLPSVDPLGLWSTRSINSDTWMWVVSLLMSRAPHVSGVGFVYQLGFDWMYFKTRFCLLSWDGGARFKLILALAPDEIVLLRERNLHSYYFNDYRDGAIYGSMVRA